MQAGIEQRVKILQMLLHRREADASTGLSVMRKDGACGLQVGAAYKERRALQFRGLAGDNNGSQSDLSQTARIPLCYDTIPSMCPAPLAGEHDMADSG